MDLLSKIFEGVVGLLPQAVASLLPEHLKRQALERVGDHNPLKSNPANQDLIRAARLAWIEAAQEVLKASLALSRREELRDQETSIADFNELMQKLLQNDRDLALDRRKDAGPSAIDIHVQAVFDGVRESNADGRPSAMRAGVTAKFTTTLASLSGWPEKEIPPIYQQIATEGVPGPSGRPQPFGDFMMGAFAELIKDPKKYPQAASAYHIEMGAVTREILLDTFMAVKELVRQREVSTQGVDALKVSPSGSVPLEVQNNCLPIPKSRLDSKEMGRKNPKNKFPASPAYFIGRDNDIERLTEYLSSEHSAPTILLQGAPGIGKTALSIAVANSEQVINKFKDRRTFVSLVGVTSVASLEATVAQALSMDRRVDINSIITFLKRNPRLLVLDNLETPWEHCQEDTEIFLRRISQIADMGIIASFRGFEVIRGISWGLIHTVTTLKAPNDLELFCRISGIKHSNDKHLMLFQKALGGLPLAIWLVASNAKPDSLPGLWQDWLQLGVSLARDMNREADAQSSLPHSIELSVKSKRLDETSRRLFRILGQLPAGISISDRRSLFRDPEGAFARIALLGAGLAFEADSRLMMLPPIREYAARKHVPLAGDTERPWTDHYLNLVKKRGNLIGFRAGNEKGQSVSAAESLVPEFGNIENLITAQIKTGQLTLSEEFFDGFDRIIKYGCLSGEIFNDLIRRYNDINDPTLEARCYRSLGESLLRRSNLQGAIESYSNAYRIYSQIGSSEEIAKCDLALGTAYILSDRQEEAAERLNRAWKYFSSESFSMDHIECLQRRAEMAVRTSSLDQANSLFIEAMSKYKEIEYIAGCADCLRGLGDVAIRQWRVTDARRYYNEAKREYESIGDQLRVVNCDTRIAQILVMENDYILARESFSEAIIHYRDLGNILGEANCLIDIARIELDNLALDSSIENLEGALHLFENMKSRFGVAMCNETFSDLFFKKGDVHSAIKYVESALNIYKEIPDKLGAANCYLRIARIRVHQGVIDEARCLVEIAGPIFKEIGDPRGEKESALLLKRIDTKSVSL